MNPCQLTTSVTALAIWLGENLDNEQLSLLGAVFNQLGDTLVTLALQRQICDNQKTACLKQNSASSMKAEQ